VVENRKTGGKKLSHRSGRFGKQGKKGGERRGEKVPFGLQGGQRSSARTVKATVMAARLAVLAAWLRSIGGSPPSRFWR
jgi:hypothetical protein